MIIECTDLNLSLPGKQAALLRPAGPATISCQKGVVWITSEGDTLDHVLEEGDQASLVSSDRIYLYAFQPAALTVRPARPSNRRIPRPPFWLLQLWRSIAPLPGHHNRARFFEAQRYIPNL